MKKSLAILALVSGVATTAFGQTDSAEPPACNPNLKEPDPISRNDELQGYYGCMTSNRLVCVVPDKNAFIYKERVACVGPMKTQAGSASPEKLGAVISEAFYACSSSQIPMRSNRTIPSIELYLRVQSGGKYLCQSPTVGRTPTSLTDLPPIGSHPSADDLARMLGRTASIER